MKIKEKRESKGLTQEELANKVGVNRSAVAMWETGKSLPRAETLLQMAEIFNCTVDELLKG